MWYRIKTSTVFCSLCSIFLSTYFMIVEICNCYRSFHLFNRETMRTRSMIKKGVFCFSYWKQIERLLICLLLTICYLLRSHECWKIITSMVISPWILMFFANFPCFVQGEYLSSFRFKVKIVRPFWFLLNYFFWYKSLIKWKTLFYRKKRFCFRPCPEKRYATNKRSTYLFNSMKRTFYTYFRIT